MSGLGQTHEPLNLAVAGGTKLRVQSLIDDTVGQNVAIYEDDPYVTIVKAGRVAISCGDLETPFVRGHAKRSFQLFRVCVRR